MQSNVCTLIAVVSIACANADTMDANSWALQMNSRMKEATAMNAEIRRNQMKIKSLEKENAAMHMESKAQVTALLGLSFSEPLNVVLARAKDNAKNMPIDEALTHVKNPEVKSLIADKTAFLENTTSSIDSNAVSSHAGLGDLHTSAIFDKAMAFLNEQFKTAREKMDIKLFECGFFKLEKEGLLYETQDRLDEIAQGISLAEATIEKCQGEIYRLEKIIAVKRAELKHHLHVCAMIRAELEKEKALLEEEVRVIDLIIDTTKKECGMKTLFMIQACVEATGETTFSFSSEKMQRLESSLHTDSAKKDLQRIMFEAYGGFEAVLPGHLSLASFIEGGDELDDDDFPEMSMAEGSFIQSGNKLSKLKDISKISIDQPSAPTKNKAGEKSRGRKCPAGAKPNCPPLLDKMAKMKGELLDLLNVKTKELEAHNAECDRITAELNGEITLDITQLGIWNTELAKATATLSSLLIEQRIQQKIKHELCNELREKYKG